MTPKLLQACEFFQPAERACWEVLLREAGMPPAMSADAMRHAIARALQQLWSLLATRQLERWLEENPQPQEPLVPTTGCGVRPVLDFFASGERALALILREIGATQGGLPPAESGRLHEEIGQAFDILVHRELEAVCGDCRHDPVCPLNGRRRCDGGAVA